MFCMAVLAEFRMLKFLYHSLPSKNFFQPRVDIQIQLQFQLPLSLGSFSGPFFRHFVSFHFCHRPFCDHWCRFRMRNFSGSATFFGPSSARRHPTACARGNWNVCVNISVRFCSWSGTTGQLPGSLPFGKGLLLFSRVIVLDSTCSRSAECWPPRTFQSPLWEAAVAHGLFGPYLSWSIVAGWLRNAAKRLWR